MHWTLGKTATSVLGTLFALHFHPPSRQMMTRFYKTIVVDITIMCMFIATCNLCVKPHVWTCTRMLAQCVLCIVLWHTWMQLLCLHFAEALFMGLEAKVCPFYGLFFMENNWMIVLDALNDFQGWVVAGLIISLYFQTHKICCFRFLPQAGRPVRYARNSSNWIRASEAGLEFYNRTPFNVALHDSFAANRDKCNPELSL